MELFTKVATPEASFKIDYTKNLAFFGSCFADNISAQFSARKFNVLANPFGTVYNPLSIARQLRGIAGGKTFGDSDVFQDERCDKLWHSFDAHSSLSAPTREGCIEKLNAGSAQALEFLQKADVAFITLGTAFVYFLKSTGEPVANCHRQDSTLFERRMVPVDEAVKAIRDIVESLNKIRPGIHTVFTVSPLRHMGDGAHGNSLSKATLLLAVNEIVKCESNGVASPATYFPSYEIVMDELRDYRFYDSDMVHLSKTAEEYIFERLASTYCDEATRTDIARVEKFLKGAHHRVADPQSPESIAFAKRNCALALELEQAIPGLNLDKERQYFEKMGI